MPQCQKRRRLCICEKNPSFGLPGGKATHCATCKSDDMIDVVNKKCPCGSNLPLAFGPPNEKATCCSRCKSSDMIDLKHERCPCGTRPTFGFEGEKPTCCIHCKAPNMTNTKHGACVCKKHVPTFGFPGEKPVCCQRCKEPGMEPLGGKKCMCGKARPHFGFPGKVAVCCAKCKEKGMEDVINRRCCSCGKLDHRYGYEGQKALYCSRCKLAGMIDLLSKRCECGKARPHFGLMGGKAVCCLECKTSDMVDVCHTMCKCGRRASYGFSKNEITCCTECKIDGMANFRHKKCVLCGLFIAVKSPFKCSYCRDDSPTYQKTREIAVLNLLNSTRDLPNFIHNKSVGFVCGNFRPDFLFDLGTHYVIVECDEDQHRSYDPECERVRMINIVNAQGLPCVFIRYNPDAFHIGGKTVRIYKPNRHRVLIGTLKRHLTYDLETSRVVYLYYDGADIREEILQ
jgi:hypothetical protein